MFIKFTRSGDRSFAQLVESFRDEVGRPRQRTLATLGRTDETGGQVDSLLQGLLRVKGRPASLASPPQVQFESALALGDVWALHQLWHELGFDRLHAVFRRARFTTPVEQANRVMVFNRLCDADSKLGALRWLQTVALPDVQPEEITHQHLLRSMDALMDHQGAVDDCVAQLLRPLIDEQLSVVFYDLTTIRTEGLSQQSGDVRKFGISKEGIVARQFMMGVVQTADGLPIYHEVFDGNASEGPTRTNTGVSHENGAIEARQGSLKRGLDQGLLLRGSREFDDLPAYEQFVADTVRRLNARCPRAWEVERACLKPLPTRRTADFEEIDARVSKFGVFSAVRADPNLTLLKVDPSPTRTP